MFKHILITTDGSELAQKGLEQGLQLAKQLGSRVSVLTVTEPFPYMATASSAGWIASENDMTVYSDNQQVHAEAILKAAVDTAEALNLTITTQHIADRWPAEAIIDYCTEHNVDLVVMTSHGRRGFGRLLLGSQTIEVLTHSKIAILVIR